MRRLAVVVVLESCVLVPLAVHWLLPKAQPIGGVDAQAGQNDAAKAGAHSGVGSSASRPQEARAKDATEPGGEQGAQGAERKGAWVPVPRGVGVDGAKAAGAVEPARLDDPFGILLRGKITTRDGGALANPSLYVGRDEGGSSAQVAKDGEYAAGGLQPGSWRANVRADGYVAQEQPLELTAAPFQQADFELVPATRVRVRIETPDGQDANVAAQKLGLHFGFHVVASAVPIPERFATTDHGVVMWGASQWRRDDRPKDGFAGTIELATPPPAYVAALLRHVVVAQARVEPGQDVVTLVVDAAKAEAQLSTVRMRLLDAETEEPLAGFHCTLRSSSGGGVGGQSGADGRLEVQKVLPGLVILELNQRVAKSPYESVTTTIRTRPGETTDLGDLRMDKGASASGVVLDEGGKPAGGVGVQWTELKWRNGPRPFVDHRSASTDAEGKFSLGRLGRGKVAVKAWSREGGLMALGILEVPCAEPLELRLAPAATLVITRPPDPTRAFVVTLYSQRNVPVTAARLEPRLTRLPIRLPPGDYAYEVHDDDDKLVASGSVRLASAPQTLELR
jgi:hypothetical protein